MRRVRGGSRGVEGGSLGWERAKVSNGLCPEERVSLQIMGNFTEGRVLSEREHQSDLGRSRPRKGFYHIPLQDWGPPVLRSLLVG